MTVRVVFLILTLLMTGCKSERRVRVGVIVSTMQETVYSFMKQAIVQEARKQSVDLIWVSSENNEAKQRFDVEALISQKPDIFIFQPVNSESSSGLVSAMKATGGVVVALDRLPESSEVDLYVTADSQKVGFLQAARLAKSLNGAGNVLILKGEEGNSVAEEITRENLRVLAQHPEISVVAVHSHPRWSPRLAEITTEQVIDSLEGNLDGILANNSAMALGALKTLRKWGLNGKVMVVGADADRQACLAILAGDLLADVDKRPDELGRTALELGLRLFRTGSEDRERLSSNSGEVPVVKTPVKLIDRENVRTEMQYRMGKLFFQIDELLK